MRHTIPKQLTLPVTHARSTQSVHAQVQKCTAHLAQQTFTHSNAMTAHLGQQYQVKHHTLALKEANIISIVQVRPHNSQLKLPPSPPPPPTPPPHPQRSINCLYHKYFY